MDIYIYIHYKYLYKWDDSPRIMMNMGNNDGHGIDLCSVYKKAMGNLWGITNNDGHAMGFFGGNMWIHQLRNPLGIDGNSLKLLWPPITKQILVTYTHRSIALPEKTCMLAWSDTVWNDVQQQHGKQ